MAPARISPALGERRLCSAITDTPGSSSASENGPVVAAAQAALELGEGHLAAPALDVAAGGVDDPVEHAHEPARASR